MTRQRTDRRSVANFAMLAVLAAVRPQGIAARHHHRHKGKHRHKHKHHYFQCGGLKGFPCPSGYFCADDPRDSCDPSQGGADCMGICLHLDPDPCALLRCTAGTRCCPLCGGMCLPNEVRCEDGMCANVA